MESFGSVFTEDCDFVNVRGMLWRGRHEIVAKCGELHRMQLKDSGVEIGHVDVRFLGPEVALIHGDIRMQGDRDPDGTPRPLPRDLVFTSVACKEALGWRMVAFHIANKVI